MKLEEVTTPGVDDLALAWIVQNLRRHAWFPAFFGDVDAGQISRIKRVLAIDPNDFSTPGFLQVGGSLIHDVSVVGEVQREHFVTYYAYTFTAAKLALPDDAVTHATVTRELVAFLRRRDHQTLGGHVACLVHVEILGLGTHQMDSGNLYRILSLVRSTHQLMLNPNTQEPMTL